MRERDVPPPLLLEPRGPLGWLRAIHVFLGLALGVVALPALLAVVQDVAGLRGGRQDELACMTLFGGMLAFVVGAWVFRRRAGSAELHADRVAVQRMSGDVEVVFFDDLDGFDDLSGDYVRLRRAADADHAAVDVPVPTPGEQGRVALLRALEAAGVPRDDGSVRPPRARAAPAPERVVQAEVAAALLPRAAGRVELLARGPRLVQDRAGAPTAARLDLSLSWDDVAAVRDVRRDLLRLVLRPGLLRTHLREPIVFTRSPAERRALLDAVAARGIPVLRGAR